MSQLTFFKAVHNITGGIADNQLKNGIPTAMKAGIILHRFELSRWATGLSLDYSHMPSCTSRRSLELFILINKTNHYSDKILPCSYQESGDLSPQRFKIPSRKHF